MSSDNMKHVDFSKWCHICKYTHLMEQEEPCNSCLAEPAREFSHKPVKFEEGKESKK